jgi:hypothetical protein
VGEGDLLLLAVAQELIVDELASVIRIYLQQLERQPRPYIFDGFQHPCLRLVAHSLHLSPPSANVRHVKRFSFLEAF